MEQQLKSSSKPSTVRKNLCLKSMMDKLYADREKTGDIEFIVDGEVIWAHRYVLAALSPRYETQFYGAMAEKDTITVKDVSPIAFKEFLQFFYTDDVTLTLDNIEDVLNLAKQSLVDELVAECMHFLIDLVGMDKIVWCYRLALVYDIKPVEELCVKHIGINIKAVFQSMDFLSCEHGMLCYVLDLPRLDWNESETFDACISWARTECKQRGINANNTANLREVLGESILKIRFDSMKIEEFAAIDRKYAGVLSAQESNEIFHAIALKESDVAAASSLFDNIRRKQCKSVVTKRHSNLECSISKGRITKIDDPENFCHRIINFCCDKTIELNGLVLCNKIEDNIVVTIQLSGALHLPQCTKRISDNKTVIIFDKPFSVPVDTICSIGIHPGKKLPTFDSSSFGFEIQPYINQHGVTFNFFYTNCSKLNIITRLLFDIVEESTAQFSVIFSTFHMSGTNKR